MSYIAPISSKLDLLDPVNATLIARWLLAEHGGSVVLDSGPHRLNGVLTNLSARAVGAPGRVLTFDGTNNYITVANALPGSAAEFAIFARIRPNFSSASATGRTVFVRSNGAASKYAMRLTWAGSTYGWYSDNVTGGSGGGYATQGNTPAFSAGEWHELGLSYTAASGGQFWWDGKPVTTNFPFATWPANDLSNLSMFIGQDGDGANRWLGDMADVRVYQLHRQANAVRKAGGIVRPGIRFQRAAWWWVGSLPPVTGYSTATFSITGSAAASLAIAGVSSATVSPITGSSVTNLSTVGYSTNTLASLTGSAASNLTLSAQSLATLNQNTFSTSLISLVADTNQTLVILGSARATMDTAGAPARYTITIPNRTGSLTPPRRRGIIIPPNRNF